MTNSKAVIINVHEAETCMSCGITHKKVEARGIYECPNPLCTVSGASWFRMTLDSYEEDAPRMSHTIDSWELLAKGILYLKDCEDKTIQVVGLQSAKKLIDEILEEMQ